MRRQRPVTVLAVLFGLLLGFAGNAQLRIDPGSARIGHGDGVRSTYSLRNAPRSEDKADDDFASGLLPPAPRVVTALVAIRPAGATGFTAAAPAALDTASAYQARAPPAA